MRDGTVALLGVPRSVCRPDDERVSKGRRRPADVCCLPVLHQRASRRMTICHVASPRRDACDEGQSRLMMPRPWVRSARARCRLDLGLDGGRGGFDARDRGADGIGGRADGALSDPLHGGPEGLDRGLEPGDRGNCCRASRRLECRSRRGDAGHGGFQSLRPGLRDVDRLEVRDRGLQRGGVGADRLEPDAAGDAAGDADGEDVADVQALTAMRPNRASNVAARRAPRRPRDVPAWITSWSVIANPPRR